ncbi:flavodoxin [Anaerobium acetethylicum]|uniref:Flavodoxin n=1 Tax=Anaerobium acetethylicum TaxID=1619234 RepID=A0A1D3TWR5_9FIRM|nr:flavodoxin [Anaerobium acetethylicum]SCP98724.1 Flavodoxin [Anaerobium acetethylicum]
MAKELVVYFSRKGNNYVNGSIKNLTVGNTEVAAGMIQDLTGADLFQIEPVTEYDADYNICIEEAQRDKRANVRPEFKNAPKDIAEYDTIYLGYPNYWGTMPMHVWTFLEKYDFTGKTIKPLCTHEGSGMGSSENDIRKLCSGAKVEKGLAIQGGSVSGAKSAIAKWL